ncbi:DUF1642 domain-containing protein [Enterococcus raffinosus]|uniref:DUF1642 domain-containing protein n=1 Tax=Enterococcus raffinosus TaxID=71452 RepID=UPI0035654B66
MDKQEVLEKLEQKKETILRSQKNLLMGSELWQVYEARAATFMSAINIVEQLNEPQKVKVPAYVAEWFEINKEQLEVAIWDLTTETYETDRDQLSEIQLWIKESDRPYKTLISMQDGYEVEEEPKWVVKIEDNGSAYFVDFFDELQPHLVYGLSGEVMRFDSEDKANAIVTLIECGTVEKV